MCRKDLCWCLGEDFRCQSLGKNSWSVIWFSKSKPLNMSTVRWGLLGFLMASQSTTAWLVEVSLEAQYVWPPHKVTSMFKFQLIFYHGAFSSPVDGRHIKEEVITLLLTGEQAQTTGNGIWLYFTLGKLCYKTQLFPYGFVLFCLRAQNCFHRAYLQGFDPTVAHSTCAQHVYLIVMSYVACLPRSSVIFWYLKVYPRHNSHGNWNLTWLLRLLIGASFTNGSFGTIMQNVESWWSACYQVES